MTEYSLYPNAGSNIQLQDFEEEEKYLDFQNITFRMKKAVYRSQVCLKYKLNVFFVDVEHIVSVKNLT